tara:strand:- start:97 stop:711 length:615 start_codon:yes stop_codon:yes gene_type:complete
MDILLKIHICTGTIALIAAAVAVLSEKGKSLHIKAGQFYVFGMACVFLTAVPMSIMTNNLFLFLIGIFSFYFAFSGWRFAKNRSGKPAKIDWFAIYCMILTGGFMLLTATWYFMMDRMDYIPLIVFGFLALSLGYQDFVTSKTQTAKGKERIAKHLTNMMGGSIAVITAVLVVNIDTEPRWIFWILPTILITPVIIWWRKKVLN